MAETAAPVEAAAPPKEGQPQTLDELMIAMDVVDTLRHREDLVARELDEEGREAELIERLRKIYHDQGIEVADRVLMDGVKALKESRFVYTPPPAGWKRTMLTAWARRQTYGRRVGGLALAVGAVAWAYYFLVVRPAHRAQEQARIELTETLPKGLRAAHAEVLRIATDQAAKEKADALLADGEREVRAGNRAGIAKVRGELVALRDELTREYRLLIVSRPREPSGVWRRPPGKGNAKNYYVIVEAIAADGRKIAVPIRSEETGQTVMVTTFGVRVPEAVFEAVRRDKADDGIVQKNVFGVRKRGSQAIEYQMPFEGGFITKW
jgi:hypothetical protein